MAKKQNNGVTPQQQRLLKTHSDALMRVEKARFWGEEPNPRDLAVIARCEKALSAPAPKVKKESKITTGTVKLPELPESERLALQEVAAGLRMEREAQIRTEILEAMRMLSIAAMPRTEAEAKKGRYSVMFPLAHDRWCRASAVADLTPNGEVGSLPWGQDRFWLKVVQTWVVDALRRDPETRVVGFPSYRSILESLEMNTGGRSIRKIQEAVERLSGCTWRFDFAGSKRDLMAGKLNLDTRPEFVRFSLIDAARLPSRKDVDREMVHGETPLQMPVEEALSGKPYFLKFSEALARTLLNPKELHIMPKALVLKASNSPLTMDFWDFCLQAAKRLSSPWRVPEEQLVGLFGQGRAAKRDLFKDLGEALAGLIEAVHPQFHAEFVVEAKPSLGKVGNPGKTWVLVIYPLRGPIEHLPPRAKGTLPGKI
jgi:hypothetical protein